MQYQAGNRKMRRSFGASTAFEMIEEVRCVGPSDPTISARFWKLLAGMGRWYTVKSIILMAVDWRLAR
jgi:hypothetical protein